MRQLWVQSMSVNEQTGSILGAKKSDLLFAFQTDMAHVLQARGWTFHMRQFWEQSMSVGKMMVKRGKDIWSVHDNIHSLSERRELLCN